VTLLPVDWVVAFYNVTLIGVWLPRAGESAVARWMIAVHAAGLGLLWLLARGPSLEWRLTRALREVYPILWLLVFWRELGLHCGLVGSAPNDAYVARLDQALFGANWSAVWAPAMPTGWLSELMQGVYFAYYVACPLVLLHLLLARGRDTARETTLRMVLVYTGAYLVYAIAPTVGPMAMAEFPRFAGPAASGLFRRLNDWLQATGDAAGTAFPSTHVAGAVTLAWLAWRHYSQRLAWLLSALALLIAPATVYTQNHFLLDAVGGALLAWWCQSWLVPFLTRSPAERRWPALGFGTRLRETEAEAA